MNNPKNNITSAGTLASIVVALLMVVLACFSCSESDTEPEADTTTVRITATLPAANVTGQTRADASIADPVPADAYPEFSLSYTKVDTDATATATAAAKGNAVAWAADGNSVTLDFSPLEWKTMKRDGSTPATVSAAGTQPDTRVSSPKRDFVSGFFTVAAGAFAPTVAPALVHQTARVAIVLKSSKADKVLVAADYTATMDITTGSTAAVPLTFAKGADTKADGAAIGTPYALLYLSAAELSIAEGSKLIISKADGTELASITLRDLTVTVAGGATTKLSTFVKGQYLTITVMLNERLELTGNPTVTVTSWTVGDEWTLNAN